MIFTQEGGLGWGWVDECKQPCQGENCARLKTKVENLLDLNSDPCDDFYKFACNVADRGKAVPPVKQPLLTFEQLVENPPQGFDYVKRFYTSCTGITTQYSSSEVPKVALITCEIICHRSSLVALEMETVQRRSC